MIAGYLECCPSSLAPEADSGEASPPMAQPLQVLGRGGQKSASQKKGRRGKKVWPLTQDLKKRGVMLDSTEETESVSYCNFIYDRFKTSTEPAATAGESNRSRRKTLGKFPAVEVIFKEPSSQKLQKMKATKAKRDSTKTTSTKRTTLFRGRKKTPDQWMWRLTRLTTMNLC